MKLTLHADFSLRVLMYVGLKHPAKSTIQEIATAFHISDNHLMKVVHRLSLGGWLHADRGRKGGLTLGVEPQSIELGKLLRELGETSDLVPCMEDADSCVISKPCVLRRALAEASEQFWSTLDNYTLADLLAPEKKLRKALSLREEPDRIV